ncbi:probable RNA-binding protein ARP1 [Camellia sinensis]|nr:probable RNA-binding protein ARP1 [Camellia sinensis]
MAPRLPNQFRSHSPTLRRTPLPHLPAPSLQDSTHLRRDLQFGDIVGPFGDTTMTNVFVGGLAWETPKEALRDHFDVYGEFLDAVIISDKITGRSKGYGFVTLKEAEAAKKACEEATPIINGRRSNCNTGFARSPTPPVRLVLHGAQLWK